MIKRLQQLFLRWNRDDAGLMSAAVAYYAVLSMFPLLLILTSVLGYVLKWTNAGQDAQHYILSAIGDQLSPALAENVQVALDQVQQHASFNGPIGFATLLIAAMAMFAQFERAFDRIWQVTTPTSTTFAQTAWRILNHRFRAFAMLVCVGVAIIAVFFAGIAFETFQAYTHERISGLVWFQWITETLLILALNATVFALLYKFLPKVLVRWDHAFRGGLFAAICWELGRQVLAGFVIGQRYSNAYGLIGSLLAIMLWSYYSFGAIFLGAEYAQLLGEESCVDRSPGVSEGHRKIPLPIEITASLFLLYLATFLGLRHYRAIQIPQHSTEEAVVVFSHTPDGQQWCKLIFSPLIATLPGPYHYPDGIELPALLSADPSSLRR